MSKKLVELDGPMSYCFVIIIIIFYRSQHALMELIIYALINGFWNP